MWTDIDRKLRGLMSDSAYGTFAIGGDMTVDRVGFGAMRLARNGMADTVTRDPATARAVLRRGVELGVNHVDIADFYRSPDGTVLANDLIRDALSPYPEGLVIATKVGPVFGPQGPTRGTAADLRLAVEANLEALGVGRLDIVYLRIGWREPPRGESLSERFEVKQHLGDTKIDMLVLNAGAQFRQAERSVDGFEMTFAVNHLSHYLLARLLLPEMADGGRIMITTSDTHDPTKMPLGPRTLDPESLAHPTKDSPARAYPASKLCNLLTARYLAASEDVKTRHISVIAYNPGFTGGTSLSGDSALQRAAMIAMRPVLRFLSLFLSQLYMSTPEQSGDALAQLVLGQVTPPPGRVYASHVRGKITFPDSSKLGQRDDARDLLWRESAPMVALPA